MYSYPDFSTRTIVITGASSGAGKAMALELALTGAKLVLAARRKEALEELAQECESLGAIAVGIPTDMRKAGDVEYLAAQAAAFGGAIDVWINNAGVLAAGALEDIPAAVNEQVIQTNLTGYIHGARAAIPYFKRQSHGILINNISVGGWFPTPYGAAYTASKFGLRGFSSAVKGELKGWSAIHVCDLYPGFLDTPGMQHSANYTGKVLKPVPPVYSPQRVGRAVISLIQYPQPSKTVGLAAALLRFSSTVFPGLSRTATVMVIRQYLKTAKDIEHTSGNVLEPVPYGTSAEGGWNKKIFSGKTKGKAWLLAAAAGVMIGISLAGSRK